MATTPSLFAASPVPVPELSKPKPKAPEASTPPPPPPPRTEFPGKLLTEREAAATLAISPRKLWQLRQDGYIPCVRIGRAVRYAEADLASWINAQRGS